MGPLLPPMGPLTPRGPPPTHGALDTTRPSSHPRFPVSTSLDTKRVGTRRPLPPRAGLRSRQGRETLPRDSGQRRRPDASHRPAPGPTPEFRWRCRPPSLGDRTTGTSRPSTRGPTKEEGAATPSECARDVPLSAAPAHHRRHTPGDVEGVTTRARLRRVCRHAPSGTRVECRSSSSCPTSTGDPPPWPDVGGVTGPHGPLRARTPSATVHRRVQGVGTTKSAVAAHLRLRSDRTEREVGWVPVLTTRHLRREPVTTTVTSVGPEEDVRER